MRARSIINKVDVPWLAFAHSINVYRGCSHACVYCFARPTHAYLGLDIGEDFDRRIVVKINAAEVLRAELSPRRWAGEAIAMGTNTDPYQRCEGKFRLTRQVLEVLVEFANPFSILTKSTLALRDLDLIAEAAQRTEVRIDFSVGTLDEDVWRLTEPGTPAPPPSAAGRRAVPGGRRALRRPHGPGPARAVRRPRAAGRGGRRLQGHRRPPRRARCRCTSAPA